MRNGKGEIVDFYVFKQGKTQSSNRVWNNLDLETANKLYNQQFMHDDYSYLALGVNYSVENQLDGSQDIISNKY